MRDLVNDTLTRANMMTASRILDRPAYEYVGDTLMREALERHVKRVQEKEGVSHKPVRYRSRNQMEQEQEELIIAGQYDQASNL